MASDEYYDIIIIGGGTAGLVLATRLSEDPNLQVLVLEAGADQKDDPRVITPAFWSTLLKTPSDWNFDTVPQVRAGWKPDCPAPDNKPLSARGAAAEALCRRERGDFFF